MKERERFNEREWVKEWIKVWERVIDRERVNGKGNEFKESEWRKRIIEI